MKQEICKHPFRSGQHWKARILSAALLLTACGRPAPPPDGITLSLPTSPATLDPRTASDAWGERVGALMYEGLLRRNAQGQLENALALSLVVSSPTRLTITLRDSVFFHDGSQLDAADVKATYEDIQRPERRSIKRGALRGLAQVEIKDPLTLELSLHEPSASFLEALTTGIVPSEYAGSSSLPPGTGPYQLAPDTDEQGPRLRAFERHWQGAPRSKWLQFRVLPDATVRALELLHGGVDLVQGDLPPYLLDYLCQQPSLHCQSRPALMTRYFTFNLRDPILQDLRVRKALVMGLNRAEIQQYKLRGRVLPACSLLPPPNLAHVPDLPCLPFDPTQADVLLREAGFPPHADGRPRLHLTYKTSQDELGNALARIFQAQWKKLGVALEIRTFEWGIFFNDIKRGNYQIYALTGVGMNDPDYLAFLLHSKRMPPDGANRARLSLPTLDALLDAGQQTFDLAQRKAHYREAEMLAASQVVYVPLWYEQSTAVMRRSLHGYQVSAAGDFSGIVHAERLPTEPESDDDRSTPLPSPGHAGARP
ncbi:MAG: ABC transporter substrate-binding protein [Myxococcota bacterium]